MIGIYLKEHPLRNSSLVGKKRTSSFGDVEIQAAAPISLDRDFVKLVNVEASSGDITAEWHKPHGRIEVIKIGVAKENYNVDSVNLKLTHIPVTMKFKRPLYGDR